MSNGKQRAAQSAKAAFGEVTWRDVPDYYWAGLTSLAGELTLATLGVHPVGGELRSVVDPFRPGCEVAR